MKKLIITEEEKQQIRKAYGLNEALPELQSYPVGGPSNIGYDENWDDFGNPLGTANTDFSKEPTYSGVGGHLKGHIGIDIFGSKGTPILAPVSGKVKYNNSNGNAIIIEDSETGYSHWLGHLDSRTVEDGDYVSAGEQVGTLGNTGNAIGTAPHLHYNIFKTSGGYESGEDPLSVLKKSIGKKPETSGETKSDDKGSKLQNILKQLFGIEDSSIDTKVEAKDEQDLLGILKNVGGAFLKNLFK